MEKRFPLNIRRIWLIAGFVLILLMLLGTEKSKFTWYYSLLMLILSFPSNLLIVPLLMNFFRFSIGMVYLITYICWIIAYLQWFILVPSLAKLFRQKFGLKDYQINFYACAESANNLLRAKNIDLIQNWYDPKKRTPVERLFEKDED
ncbi:MAG: hypothetical protein ABI954_10990 [Pyrinomonadaceae bacterium]